MVKIRQYYTYKKQKIFWHIWCSYIYLCYTIYTIIQHTMKTKKILHTIPILLIALVTVLTLRSEFGNRSDTATIQVQSVQEDGRMFDDRGWAEPAFRVQSDLDTTEVDKKIESYYTGVLKWTKEYLTLSDQEIWSRLREMCKYYDDICHKMQLKVAFSLREVYNFTVFSIYVITQIDNNTQLEWIGTLRDTLASMQFTKDKWHSTRWSAWYRNLLINTYEMRDKVELLEIIVHEIGHIMDLWVIHDDNNPEKHPQYQDLGEPAFGIKDWSLRFYSVSWQETGKRRNTARDKHFISWYSHTNAKEGFAEFFNTWINHHSPLLELAKTDDSIRKKYFLFQELFGKRYLNADVETYRTLDKTTRPYDSTRRHDAAIKVE